MSIIRQKLKSFSLVSLALILVGFLVAMGVCFSPKSEVRAEASGLWSDYTTARTFTGNDITIGTAGDLALVAKLVNEGTDSFEDKTIFITADIDIGAHYWVPIGTQEHPFKGKFRVQTANLPKTISNLTIKTSELENASIDCKYLGLFGYVNTDTSTAVGEYSLFRITLSNISIICDTAISGALRVGAFAGQFTGSAKEVNANGTIDFTNATATQDSYIGGLFGEFCENSSLKYTNKGTSQVTFAGDTASTTSIYLGGIVGKNAAEIDGTNLTINDSNTTIDVASSRFGGFVGLNVGTIKNCKNFGTINLTSGVVGGIASLSSGIITDCSNSAKFYVTQNLPFTIGGIAGQNSGTTAQISGCSNSGAVSGLYSASTEYRYAGGIAGANGGKIYGCKNTANLGTEIDLYAVGGIVGQNAGEITVADTENLTESSFNYNTGTISGAWAGGIAGANEINAGNISYSYNLGDVSGTPDKQSYIGGIIGSVNTALNIYQCFNLANIGNNKSSIVGGLVGYAQQTLSINYSINYGNLLGTGHIAGLVGNCLTAGININISNSLALGDVDNTEGAEDPVLSGIINTPKQNTLSLTQSLYNKSIANYDDTKASRNNGMTAIKNISTADTQTTCYRITKPGVENSSFDTNQFFNDSSFTFYDQVNNTHYYPILTAFEPLFTTNSQESGKILVPSVVLFEVEQINNIPSWNDATSQIVYAEEPISTYTASDLEYVSIDSRVVQFVVGGQKLVKPSNYTSPNGFEENWQYTKSGTSTKQAFNFSENTISATTSIYLDWVGKTYNVTYYTKEYKATDYVVLDELKQDDYGITQTTIQYSLNPSDTQAFAHIVRNGYTFNGWWAYASAQSGTIADDSGLVSSRDTDFTYINRNFFYENGLHLYGEFTAKQVEITLNAGEINGNQVRFADGNATTKTVTLTYGESATLPHETTDFSNTNGYVFAGYALLDGTRVTEDTGMILSSTFENPITIYATWQPATQTVIFYGINPQDYPDGKELDRLTIAYGATIKEADLPTFTYPVPAAGSPLDVNGFEIKGYYKDKAGTEEFNFTTEAIKQPTDIYVLFEAKKFNLIINANTGYFNIGGVRYDTAKIQIPYNENITTYTYTDDFKSNGKYAPILSGYTAGYDANGYLELLRTTTPPSAGLNFDASLIISIANNNYLMPASDLTVYVAWESSRYNIILHANGGEFFDDISGILDTYTLYNQTFGTLITDCLTNAPTPQLYGYGLKGWSDTEDGELIPSNLTMPANDLHLYALWGETVTVTFYVTGVREHNILRTITVFKGEKLTDTQTLQEIQASATNLDGGGFLFKYWVEVVSVDKNYNIETAKSAFNFNIDTIDKNLMLLAVLERDPNFVMPSFNVQNYVIIAVGVIIVAVVLMFLLIWSHTKKKNISLGDRKVRNKEIQKQLDEIKELEKRRRNLDNPFD